MAILYLHPLQLSVVVTAVVGGSIMFAEFHVLDPMFNIVSPEQT